MGLHREVMVHVRTRVMGVDVGLGNTVRGDMGKNWVTRRTRGRHSLGGKHGLEMRKNLAGVRRKEEVVRVAPILGSTEQGTC
jgi:hypothetical protein